MKTVELSSIYLSAIVVFLENVERYGYDPQTDNLKEWLLNRSVEENEEMLNDIIDELESIDEPDGDE